MFGLSPKESFFVGMGALWVFSAAAAALPPPLTTSSPFYKWFFGFMKTISGDLASVFGKYLPPDSK